VRTVPVLIVGGGPVGLALAADLGWRGIGCELIEQTDGSIATPKMNEVNVRTMEFCRRWGIADQVLNCPFPADYPFDVVFVTSLDGYEIGRMPRPSRSRQTPERYSPMRLQACSQMWFDPMLRALAQAAPCVRLRHRTRLEAFEDTGDGVVADLVDLQSGARERVMAGYLVGCDGATSTIRDALGIGLAGPGMLGHPVHLFFRAPDLLKQCGKAPGAFFLAIDRDGLWANIRIIDPVNAMWRLMVLDAGGRQTGRERRQGGVPPPRGRPAGRGRLAGLEHLDAPQPGRGSLFERPGIPCRRCRASALADRRARDEHRHRRRGRSRLEACGDGAGLGRAEPARELR
jgi:hypothetical protein